MAARDFETTAGGHVFARSIDGAVTGIHCDVLLVDDPVPIRDSGNITRLEWVNRLFYTVLMTRLNNPSTDTVVIVHQLLNRREFDRLLIAASGVEASGAPSCCPGRSQILIEERNLAAQAGRAVADAYMPQYDPQSYAKLLMHPALARYTDSTIVRGF